MKEQNGEQQPLQHGEEWFIDQPAYGYHSDQSFSACYELNGQTFAVVIQGFVKEGAALFQDFRYRVTYESGEEKILEYLQDTGFAEEGCAQSEHAKQLGVCIERHFSEEPSYDAEN